ncbi:hypothetical protein GGF50DRAFT_125626 [Schizophyllum commune]
MPWTRTTKESGTTQRKSTKSTRTYTSRKNNGLGMSQASWRRMVINDALEEADELEAEFQARKRAREEEEAPTSAPISASISAPKEKENAATTGSVLPPAKRQRVTRASKPAPVGTPYEGVVASSSATTSTATTSTRTTRSAAASTTATAASRNSSAVPPRHGPATTSASFSRTRPNHQDMKAIPDALKPKIPVLFPEVFDPVLYAKFAAMYKAGVLPGYPPAGAGPAGGSGAAPVATVPSAGSSIMPTMVRRRDFTRRFM